MMNENTSNAHIMIEIDRYGVLGARREVGKVPIGDHSASLVPNRRGKPVPQSSPGCASLGQNSSILVNHLGAMGLRGPHFEYAPASHCDSLSVPHWDRLRAVPSRLVPRARTVPVDILVARRILSRSEVQ
jgi:hypothetical protein